MRYVGLQEQIGRNNRYSVLLLVAFPVLLLGMLYVILQVIAANDEPEYGYTMNANESFIRCLPFVVGGVIIWFLIAYDAFSAAYTILSLRCPRSYSIAFFPAISLALPAAALVCRSIWNKRNFACRYPWIK